MYRRLVPPGTLRVTKGYGAAKHEAELDSTLARIIGSDWGDRSHQSVSLPMRLYWIVFALVLGNGVYTFVAGKDESFLLEKLKKKLDETWGAHDERDEFAERNETHETSLAASDAVSADSMEGTGSVTLAKAPSASVLTASSRGTMVPVFVPPGMSVPSNARQSLSMTELEQQLVQLRVQQERLQQEMRSGEGALTAEEAAHQVRMLDIQKEQVKAMMKSL
ncbi:unnamed protein product [Hyaloperonospora brassicae]|uniref:Uncharacterized protein n=1 Tax=Hyaloperonospora brassicae TaxID=162125 RepID=A0AAV0URK1_HYABA|nr:unnamed protein product [Hyaloperonospora brassicae]